MDSTPVKRGRGRPVDEVKRAAKAAEKEAKAAARILEKAAKEEAKAAKKATKAAEKATTKPPLEEATTDDLRAMVESLQIQLTSIKELLQSKI